MLTLWLSLLAWGFLFWYAHNHPIKGVPKTLRGGGGGDDEAPNLPSRPTAESAITGSPRLSELDQMIRQYIGKSLNAPGEWGTQGDIYQQLLGYTPQQFAYPMADIQKALEAQQALQLQQYQQQIRPILANQGQIDSTYYANLIGQYLQGQQAQTYGTTANLLTNQAQQNLALSQWLPQFKANIAGQLGGLGSQKLGLEEQNLMLPLNTYIPGLQNIYGMGSGVANQQYQDAMTRYQYDLQNQQNEQAQRGGMFGALGTLGGAGLGAGLGALFAAPTGGMSLLAGLGYGALGGAMGGNILSPLWGGSGGGIDLGNALGLMQMSSGLGSSTYQPNWNKPIQGGIGGSLQYSPQFGQTWSPYR